MFVVPAFNEEQNLPRLLDDLEQRPWLFPSGSRVIIVDDGSTDGTGDVVRSYAGPLPLTLVALERNGGPGAAFRAGFATALSDLPEHGETYVVTLEADTTSDLDALPAMLGEAQAGADLVLASVHGGGRIVNVGRFRCALSRGAGVAIRHGLGIDAMTVSSFFRVYRASLLQKGVQRFGDDLIRESGFACKAELLSKCAALGAAVVEIPVALDGAQRLGESKMRVLPTFMGYVRLLMRRRVLPQASPP